MLFISPNPLYQLVGITDEHVDYHPTNGRILKTVRGIDAEFSHGGAPSWAVDQALQNPRFQGAWKGLPDGVDYRAYVGTFDTDEQARQRGWDDETREFVEEFMLNYHEYGLSYARAIPPQQIADLPWPNYNETHHFQVASTAKSIGADLQKCLDYELTHKNRPAVVKSLEEALAADPQPTDELVPA